MSGNKIIIVGLGPGDPDQLTVAALRTIEQAGVIYLRTAKHPTVPHLPTSVRRESFDDVYDHCDSFQEVYATIVQQLIELAQNQAEPVVYAVPGHPLVGEASVLRLLEEAKKAGLETRIVDGLSFLEPAFSSLGIDPLAASLLILDATELAGQAEQALPRENGFSLPALRPILIGQIYNQRLAGAVKLALMEVFPDDHPVTLLRGAGIPGEEGRLDILLYELDRHPEWTDHLTCAYLPGLAVLDALGTFDNAQYIVSRLRAPDGCQWDREQTHASLKRHLIEETYEVIQALDEDPDKLPGELGDLLLQILLHAQIAAEDEDSGWNIAEVMREMSSKLIRRHPHIFAEPGSPRPNWEELKQAEKAALGEEYSSVLAGVPRATPALQQIQAIQRKAGALGFEWRSYDEVIAKLVEEVTELKNISNQEELVEEFGDVLAVMASAALWLKVDAEEALRLACDKFRRRFAQWEIIVRERQLPVREMTFDELQSLWMEARQRAGK